MSDLFEDNDEETGAEVVVDFSDIEENMDVEPEVKEVAPRDLDARRRLEKMMDERRLRDELNDFVDY